jgi:uncharacterized membrane protein YhaH (DUF805 family)
MLGAMKYHAGHLFDFGGRDARQTFWFWFLFLFILNIAIGMAMSLPMTISAMSTAFEGARTGDPAAAQAAMMNQMADSMRPLIVGGIIIGLFNVVMMAAALVRRLHDSGKSGVWAALTGAIYLASLALSWFTADEIVAMMREAAAAGGPQTGLGMPVQLGWQSLLGYVPMIMVIVVGVLGSDPGPNRYGEEPVRF